MDNFSDRKKALLLSILGSLGITVFIYGTGLFISYVLDETQSSTSQIYQSDTVDPINKENQSGVIVAQETFNEASPYQFQVSTYVFKGEDELVNQYNQSIKNFVSGIRDNFENDLLFYTDSVNSPESSLSINAIDIVRESNQVKINFQIEQFIVGDSGPTLSNQTLVL